MRIVEDGAARILVDTTRLHADETVLADVDDADTVSRTDFVEFRQEFDRT